MATTKPSLTAEVASKLEAARGRLAAIEERIHETTLEAVEGRSGAAGRLSQFNSDRDLAARDVAQLEGAHRLAIQRDAAAQAARDAKARRGQLDAFKKCADERLEVWIEVCAALEVAAKSYTKFLTATAQMASAMPTGVVEHHIQWQMVDIMQPDGRVMPVGLDIALAAELWRHADPRRAGHPSGALPGARPPIELLRLQPDRIEPAVESVRRMNSYLIALVRARFESLEQADAGRFAKAG